MRAFDLAAALSLLSRLPVPIDHARAGARGARAAWAYPWVGLLLGAAQGGALLGLTRLGVDPGPAAALALGLGLLLTGALHEDGLADAADGLGATAERARALEIMKDSRIGVFGAAAVGVSLLARGSALAALARVDPLLALGGAAAAGAVSRSVMAAGLSCWPNARRDGLAAGQGRAPGWAAAVALVSGAMIALGAATLGSPWIDMSITLSIALSITLSIAWVAAMIAGFLTMAYAARRLGGQTGDTLGAAQQAAEIVFLAALTTA